MSARVATTAQIAKRVIRFAFSEKVTMIVAIAVATLMWLHIATIDDTIAMNRAIAKDCLCLAPWGIAWIVRNATKKGGLR